MNQTSPEFKRSAVQPIVCLKAGWGLIKDQYWLFLGMAVVGIAIGSMVPMGILLGPMMCGLHLAFFRRAQGEQAQFDELTQGFEYFAQSLIATLFQVIPLMVIFVPVYLISSFGFLGLMARSANTHRDARLADFGPMILLFVVMMAIVFAVSMIAGALFLFTYPLIVDKKLSGVEAVKISIKAVFANLGGVFGLMFLTMLISFVGLLFCYVGALLVMPVGLAARHIAYKQVFAPVSFDGIKSKIL
jgi:hypothetical protein